MLFKEFQAMRKEVPCLMTALPLTLDGCFKDWPGFVYDGAWIEKWELQFVKTGTPITLYHLELDAGDQHFSDVLGELELKLYKWLEAQA